MTGKAPATGCSGAAGSPDLPAASPCRGTANTVLELLDQILLERAEKDQGDLPLDEVRKIIDRFKSAPGDLVGFYEDTRSRCHAAAIADHQATSPLANFEERFRELGAQLAGSMAVGRLQMVGMKALRERLGDRWEELSERIEAVSDQIMRRMLSQGDAYLHNADGDILICFADLTDEQAWFQAKKIQLEIQQKLLGCDEARKLLGEDLELGMLSQIAEIQAEAHGMALPLTDLDQGDSATEIAVRRLDLAGELMHERVEERLADLRDGWQIVPRAVMAKAGASPSLSIAGIDDGSRRALDRLLPAIAKDTPHLLEVDLLALSASALYITDHPVQLKGMLAVRVHAATVLDPTCFEQYARTCEEIPPEIRNRLIFILIDLPRTARLSQAADCLKRLRGYSRLQGIELDLPRLLAAPQDLGAAPLYFVDHACAAAALRQDPKKLKGFVLAVHQAKARLLIDRVPDGGAIADFLLIGIDLWSLRHPVRPRD